MTELWRIYADPGGQYAMAAKTPEEAGEDVARALRDGAKEVTVEQFEMKAIDDLSDAFGDIRLLAKWREEGVLRG